MKTRETRKMLTQIWKSDFTFILLIFTIFCFLTASYVIAAITNYGMEGDEVFSYISSTSQGGYKGICFLDDQTWYEGSYFQDALTATGAERFNYKMVVENQAMDTHPPFYYLLLNFVASLFPGQFSRWFGIGLNIFLMFFVWAGLYLLFQYFLNRKYLSAFFSTLFCCSYLSFSMVLFIRMYVLLMAICLFQAWYHLKLYDAVRTNSPFLIRSHWKSYVVLSLLTICGAWTHYYFIIFQGLISCLFVVILWFQKRRPDMFRYIGCMAASGAFYILLYPASLNHLFFKYRGRDAIHKFLKGSSLFGEVSSMLSNYNEQQYHGLLFWLVLLLLFFTLILFAKHKIAFFALVKGCLLLLPSLTYFFGISKASPFVTLRYITPVAPLLFAAVVIWVFRLLEKAQLSHKAARILAIFLCAAFVPICAYWWKSPLKPSFFSEKKEVIEELSDISNVCVYVTGDEYNWKMWEDYLYYPFFDGLFFIDGNQRKPIRNERLSSQENIVLFIDSALDADVILDYLTDYLPFHSYELIYTAQYNFIYLAR